MLALLVMIWELIDLDWKVKVKQNVFREINIVLDFSTGKGLVQAIGVHMIDQPDRMFVIGYGWRSATKIHRHLDDVTCICLLVIKKIGGILSNMCLEHFLEMGEFI